MDALLPSLCLHQISTLIANGNCSFQGPAGIAIGIPLILPGPDVAVDVDIPIRPEAGRGRDVVYGCSCPCVCHSKSAKCLSVLELCMPGAPAFLPAPSAGLAMNPSASVCLSFFDFPICVLDSQTAVSTSVPTQLAILMWSDISRYTGAGAKDTG